MPVLLLLLLAAFVEISVLVLVGEALGVLPTLGLLLLAGAAGVWLMRREGRRTLVEFGEAARQRRPPNRELADGVLIAAGGVLVLLPGFVSDVIGLLFLLPPTRALLRRRLQRAAERRSGAVHEQARARWAAANSPHRTGEDVIDGEVVSVDDDGTPGTRDRSRHEPPLTIDPPADGPGASGAR